MSVDGGHIPNLFSFRYVLLGLSVFYHRLVTLHPLFTWPADNPRHTMETTQDKTGFAIVVNAKLSRLWL